MSELACDRCDRSLLAFEDVRYELRIEVKAAYDPMEMNPSAQPSDLKDEIRKLIEATEGLTADEIEATVYKEFKFDLCLRCQREFLQDPLPRRPPEPPTQPWEQLWE